MAGSNLRPIVCSPYHSASAASRRLSLSPHQTGAVYSHNKRCSDALLYRITPRALRGGGDTIAETKNHLPSFALVEEFNGKHPTPGSLAASPEDSRREPPLPPCSAGWPRSIP